jgi:hypothetical protein
MCQNMTKGPLVICSSPKGDDETIFKDHDDPDGEDVRAIPAGLLVAPAFAAALQKGTLRVVSGEDNAIVQAALSKQTKAFWNRYEKEQASVIETMQAPAENDMVAIECMGPGTRQGHKCETMIPVRAREVNAEPPLCDAHAHLKNKCIRRGGGQWELEG